MKAPWEWSEDDLRALIANQVEESLSLEYKACDALGHADAKKKELSKDVSSFANSAGGAIVYGIIEAKRVPTRLDVGYLPTDLAKEWVEQVINGSIQRRIDGVRINPVRLTGADAGRVVYVISIPQSTRAPHMAADHKFYKRFNFESVPMEEYEVRDVAHRSEAPDLSLDLHWARTTLPDPIVELEPFILNVAPEPATHVVIRLYVDARMTILDSAGLGGPVAHHLSAEHGEVAVGILSLNWGLPLRMPIWEGEPFRLIDTPIRVGLPPGYGRYVIGWRLTAPRMSPKLRFYSLLWDGDIRVVEHR